jgi:hypothetical protein
MKFYIDDLQVLFPFPSMYREQHQYMVELKKALDAKGHCLLEMPTGTGKTVALLSLILSYQHAHTETRKLVYCTRTVHEMTQVINELKVVEAYRRSVLGGESQLFGMCLSSRRNLCINQDVLGVGDREQIDALCRERISEWVRRPEAEKAQIRAGALVDEAADLHDGDDDDDDDDAEGGDDDEDGVDGGGARAQRRHGRRRGGGGGSGAAAAASAGGVGGAEGGGGASCSFYENYERVGTDAIPCGIYSLDDLKQLGRDRGWCPYFAARHLLSVCNIVVYNYQYVRACVRACVGAYVRAVRAVRACVRACVCACVRACVPACVPACLRACLPACLPACVRAWVCACLPTSVRACVCAHVHACGWVVVCASVWRRKGQGEMPLRCVRNGARVGCPGHECVPHQHTV